MCLPFAHACPPINKKKRNLLAAYHYGSKEPAAPLLTCTVPAKERTYIIQVFSRNKTFNYECQRIGVRTHSRKMSLHGKPKPLQTIYGSCFQYRNVLG